MTRLRGLLVAVDVRDDHAAVLADAHLRAVVVADAHPLLESERLGQPGDGGTDVRVDEHRDHGCRRQ